jgi:hypothetical protein
VSTFAALTPAVCDEDRPTGDSCGAAFEAGSGAAGAAGTSTSTGENEPRLATGGLFFPKFLVLIGFADAALPAGFCEPLTPAVGTERLLSFAGVVESCEAHMAAKLPEFRAPELARPRKPEAEAGAKLLVIAVSMVEVTV